MLKIIEKPYDYTLDYSLLNKPRSEVYGFICGLVQRMEVCQTLGITISEFLDFLIDVDRGYKDNPYHSFYHAVDVVMVLYHFLELYEMSEHLTRIEVTLLIIAALCHDIGHVRAPKKKKKEREKMILKNIVLVAREKQPL